MKPNYDEMLEKILTKEQKASKSLLLHTCCAPCSSAVIERLANVFQITILYYNPNIEPFEEYQKRKEEQKKFLQTIQTKYPVSFFDCDYEHEAFLKIAKGYENEKERGARCPRCFRLRLEKTAFIAKQNHFDYFGTSLTVSPYKNAQEINEIGKELEEKYQVSFLFSDFKKKNGYLRSIELSKKYHLYRQDYCGCKYSQKEREEQKEKNLFVE